MPARTPEVEILLPIHNEGASIAATLDEIFDQISPVAALSFLLCEDGSRDNTKEVLREVATRLPSTLLLSEGRKGYSKAVRDGMLQASAPYLLCLDSDGQCDPRDFARFWEVRNQADVIIGWRTDRADTWVRRTLSRGFYHAWRALYGLPIHDPSCPFMLTRREVVQHLVQEVGAMDQGFWWEWMARVHRRGYTVKELPVHHRLRAAGETQVYRWSKMAGIGVRHVRALFQIWEETRQPSVCPVEVPAERVTAQLVKLNQSLIEAASSAPHTPAAPEAANIRVRDARP